MGFLNLFLRGVAILPSLVQGIEGLYGSKAGVDKKQAAIDIAGSSIKIVEAIASKQIMDGAGFQTGLGQIVDGVVACLNASIWHKA